MPARGRRTPRTYKPAEHYLGKIQVFHPDQQRLKDQLLSIFSHDEEEGTLLRRIHEELSDGLLVSREVVTNPEIYRCARDALESRGIIVPDTVLDTNSGSFIAKRVIAAIWHEPSCKIKRDSLLLEYHNIRQEVVKASKEVLQQRQAESTRIDSDLPSGPGQSSHSRHTQEEITAAERNIRYLSQEEQLDTDKDPDEASEEEIPQSQQVTNPVMNPEQSTVKEATTRNRMEQTNPNITNAPQPILPTNQNVHPPFSDERLAADAHSVEIIGTPGFNPYSDDNITRRPRDNQTRTLPQFVNQRNPAPTNLIPATRNSEDVRNLQPTEVARNDKNEDCSTRELLGVVTRLLDKLDKATGDTGIVTQQTAAQSPSATNTNWTDPEDLKRRAGKALATKFDKKMFSGAFGDNWERHQDRFLKACRTWKIPNEELVEFLPETLTGDALNYVEAKVEENMHIGWNALSKLMSERYSSINRQKEISDRLHSMRYHDFHKTGESPATTLDRITAFIDKMAVLALPVDRTDEAKARFVSNVTRGQIWAYHAKGRIAPTATYDRIIQAFATSIRDRAELETGRYEKGAYSRKGSYHRSELYKTGRSSKESPRDHVREEDSEEVFLNERNTEPLTREELKCTLDTYFENAKFANHPKYLKNNQRNSNGMANKYSKFKTSTSSGGAHTVGCFNCGRQGCSVATCKRPRDASRIAQNISRWKQLRKMDKSARININSVPPACGDSHEANEVMIAAIFVNQYQDESDHEELQDGDNVDDPFANLNETLRSNAIEHSATSDDSESDPFEQCEQYSIGLISSPHDTKIDILRSCNIGNQNNNDKAKYGSSKFFGACLDTGAQRSVCGLEQARAYQRIYPNSLTMTKSNVQFKFGEQIEQGVGNVCIKVPVDEGNHIDLNVDVVDLDIPLIIGLDVLRGHKLLVNYIDNTMHFCNFKINRPIKHKLGHMFLEWDAHEILFTREELVRLHLHFMHPSASKLYQLISRADPSKANPTIKRLVEEVSTACDNCKSYRASPLRFKAAIPNDRIIFNQTISVDLLWLHERPVLHVLDDQTGYRNATFLKSKSAEDIWNAFLGCWATVYVGYPSKIRSDQESALTSEQFLRYASAHGVELEFTGVSSHNSMGKVESAHGPLRRIYRMLTDNYPELSDNLRLRFSIKALNDTAGTKGLVPSLLVYGTIPSLGNTGADLPDQEDRFTALAAARKEAACITAEKRIRLALKSNIPPSAKYTLHPGQKVMVYSEKMKKWISNIRVVQLSSKQVWVNYNNRVIKVSRTQVLPQPLGEGNNGISSLLKRLYPLNSMPHPNILLTEVLQPNDERCESEAFDLAKAKEIIGLLEKGAFRVVLREDIGEDANILGGRFVLTIKHKDTENELFKARFVVQGHLDREKELLVHASTTASQQAIRLLVSLATIFGFKLWSQDMTLAYIQGADKILRKIYIKGKPEFQLAPNQLLEILRPLYGLADSGDYWHATFLKHLKKDLGMHSTACDLSLFFKQLSGTLHGIVATHVDDTLSAGDKKFEQDTRITARRFDAKPREYETLNFAGVSIETQQNGSRLMHQAQYAAKIELLDKNCDYEIFRSRRHELAWITHTRPDVAAEAAILAQVTIESFSPNHITQLNRAIKRVKKEPKLGLLVHQLDVNSLYIIAHADSSFANLPDLKSQLGFVILLSDKTGRVNWLHFRSYKCKRIVRSVLGGETHAFVDSFDAAFSIRHDLQKMANINIPLKMVTDSDSLFKVIVQSSTTTERRLMIDIEASREAYRERKIDNMGWIRSDGNLADGLTKINKTDLIQQVMRTGRLGRIADQWVIRPRVETSNSTETRHDTGKGHCQVDI